MEIIQIFIKQVFISDVSAFPSFGPLGLRPSLGLGPSVGLRTSIGLRTSLGLP